MVRIWIIGIALALALAMPATAQQRSVPQILERLHALCDQNYKPACIKLGFVIGRLQPGVARKLRRDHPEWSDLEITREVLRLLPTQRR